MDPDDNNIRFGAPSLGMKEEAVKKAREKAETALTDLRAFIEERAGSVQNAIAEAEDAAW